MTKDNIKDTVIKDGFYTVAEICTGKYKAACDKHRPQVSSLRVP